MTQPPRGTPDFRAIAANLELLASETRLEILHALRAPRMLHEIRAGASRTRRGENPERSLARQSISHHLELLQQAGLVQRLPDAAGKGERFVLNHERLFALVDEMRGLSKLRPVVSQAPAVGETFESHGVAQPADSPRPRLLLAYGRDDGLPFRLSDEVGASWRVGRSSQCEIALDYDPFLSSEHCLIERTRGGFTVKDVGSTNGTWVNWGRLEAQVARGLVSGDVVMAGRSLLVFQP